MYSTGNIFSSTLFAHGVVETEGAEYLGEKRTMFRAVLIVFQALSTAQVEAPRLVRTEK
jgi:hypothetical protein